MTKQDTWPYWKDFFESGSIISRNKNEFLLGWGKRERQDAPTPESDLLFYFPNFFLTKPNPWYKHEFNQTFTAEELLRLFESIPLDPLPTFQWKNEYEAFYAEQFSVLQQLFREQKLDKAVPFVYDRTITSMNPSVLYHCLKNALRYLQSHSAFIMGFWEDGMGSLSISPELLFELQYKNEQAPRLNTVALGGTFFSNDLSMLKDERLLHEHEIIVDRIVHNLSPFGIVHRDKLEALPFAKIFHLLTKIHVDVYPNKLPRFEDVVKALHPTPALGASPPEEGRKWLNYYQTFIDRFCYGAPAGYQWKEQKEAKCYVNIRNLQWNSSHILIAGGGGVTAKSHLDSEWLEILNKIKSIKSIFQIA
jgi:menaquinone-specific isochorismate synthase